MTGRRMHGKDCEQLIRHQHKILATTAPDLNSLDFSVWTKFEENPCKTHHNNIDEI